MPINNGLQDSRRNSPIVDKLFIRMQTYDLVGQWVLPHMRPEAMENVFYHTFRPVIFLMHYAGLYLPNSKVVYPRYRELVRPVVHFLLVLGVFMYASLAGGVMAFVVKGEEAEGMVKYYVVLATGTLVPESLKLIYLQIRSKRVRQIMEIWEKDLQNPPHPEDRKLEIEIVRKAVIRILKFQVFGVIIPLVLWVSRPLVTHVEVVPTAFPGNHYESPTFEYITTITVLGANHVSAGCSAIQSLQLLFMNSVLAEIKHLDRAIEKMFTVPTASHDKQLYPNEVTQQMATNGPSNTNNPPIYYPVGTVTDDQIREVRLTLKIWVRHHQNLLRYNKAIEEFMGPLILLQASTTIIFGFTNMFIVVMGELRIDNRIEAGGYLLFYYFILFLSCYLGDDIQMQSKNIMQNFHGKQWYLFPKDIITSVCIIQEVTINRPIKLTACGFKDLSCRTFEQITRKGYEVITLMAHLLSRNQL